MWQTLLHKTEDAKIVAVQLAQLLYAHVVTCNKRHVQAL